MEPLYPTLEDINKLVPVKTLTYRDVKINIIEIGGKYLGHFNLGHRAQFMKYYQTLAQAELEGVNSAILTIELQRTHDRKDWFPSALSRLGEWRRKHPVT